MQCHLILSRNVGFEKLIPPVPSEDQHSENNHESNMPGTCWMLTYSSNPSRSILLHTVYRYEK